MMIDQEEEDLQMAMKMSMQPPSHSPPDPKRSKPRDVTETSAIASEDSPEAKTRRLQRELMAAAAEKRMSLNKPLPPTPTPVRRQHESSNCKDEVVEGVELCVDDANKLFSMVFGSCVSKEILAQWSNQGIRFSLDSETSMGLVQHEGGPCGVLAAIQVTDMRNQLALYLSMYKTDSGDTQLGSNGSSRSVTHRGKAAFIKRCWGNDVVGFVLKHLLFAPQQSSKSQQRSYQHGSITQEKFATIPEDTRKRALVRSMAEILLRCGNNKKVLIATLDILDHYGDGTCDGTKDEIVFRALEGFSIESASDLQKTLRVSTYTSSASAIERLESMIPVFESRMGAMLFLISALLSRGLDSVQSDRDDPSLPLVTAPFGHASQEIVNLLLCGEAVANVFDEKIDLGGGMFLKGISTNVEVGFLTLLESLNFCKVGQNLKRPRWPIWVVGSESHYTVLFAFDPSVQEENEMEGRETKIRCAFDAQDQSGGGGFISVEGLHQVLKETRINLPLEKLDQLSSAGFIVWSEFWQVLLDLDKNLGGFKDSSGLMGKKVFDIYHFNGIAKSVPNGNHGETPVQRPRLTKLRVSVPPRWTPEEYMAESAPSSSSGTKTSGKDAAKAGAADPPQHAPLVDCIRTRWPRASCNWTGDPPSIV